MIKVSFPRKLSAKIYRKAKKAFPNEEYAILLGNFRGQRFFVKELYFPPERLNVMSPDFVPVQPEWFTEAHKYARSKNLYILGDIHSHCYEMSEPGFPGTDPSEADWEYAEYMKKATGNKYRLMGIVRVLKREDKYMCRSRFWPAVNLPVTVA